MDVILEKRREKSKRGYFKVLSILMVLLFNNRALSQNLVLEIVDPVNAKVCQQSSLGLKLINTSDLVQNDIQLKLSLPQGIDYLVNSVLNAVESNISSLTRPEFTVSSLKSHDTVYVELQCFFSCLLVDKINQSETFSNKWIINYNSKTDSLSSNQPYKVETPYLVISNVADTNVLLGANFLRFIYVTNSRLGSLKQFTFEDQHGPLDIHSSSGKQLKQTNDALVLKFGPSDFVKIGNQDSLFDRDEKILIIEEINHKSCMIEQIQSDFRTIWGCGMDTCQTYREHSNINFKQPNQFAKIQFSKDTKYPTCICSNKGEKQLLIVRNTGGQTMVDIEITLNTNLFPSSQNPYGILRESIQSSGDASILDTVFIDSLTLSTCKTNSAYRKVVMKISELAAGKELQINFNYTSCLECTPTNEQKLYWYWSYSYNTKCVPSPPEIGMNLVAEMINPNKNNRLEFKILDAAGVLEDQKVYKLESKIIFPQNITNQYLIIDYTIPCPLRLTDTSFLILGKKPIEKTIIEDSTYYIHLVYAPPFPPNISQEFPIKVDCDFICDLNDVKGFNTNFISSCPNKQLLIANLNAANCLDVKLSCPNREFDCGTCVSSMNAFEVDCRKFPTVKDTIYGYLQGDVNTYRRNYGFSDPEDDRFKNAGNLDLNLVRKKYFITGDTLVCDFNLEVFKEDEIHNYDSIIFMVNSILSFDTVITEIEITDKSTGTKYKCIYPVFEDADIRNGVPNCKNAVVSRTNNIGGLLIPVTTGLLNLYGAGLPSGFRFEVGDSIKAKINCRIVNRVEERILNIPISYKAFFINRSQIKPDPFSCIHVMDNITMASFGIRFTHSFDSVLVCKENFDLFKTTIEGTESLQNLFLYEFRPFFHLDSFKIFINNNQLAIDSILAKFIYKTKSGNQLIDSLYFPIRKRINYWEIDPALLTKHLYDEAYTIELIPKAHIIDCHQFNFLDNLITTASYVNGTQGAIFYIHPKYDTFYANHIFSGSNTLSIFNGNTGFRIPNNVIYSSSNRINWPAQISNLKLNGGFVFEIISKNNSIRNFNIEIDPNVDITKLDSFNILVGNIQKFHNYDLKFSANHKYCAKDTLLILSRWLCQSDSSSIKDLCNQDTLTLIIVPEYPELEMKVVQENKAVLLCDTLPEILIEIYNADKGVAYDIHLDILKPSGIEWIPAALEYSYPKGSNYKTLPLPTDLGSGKFRWNFADFIPELLNGLPGIENIPRNAIELKMKWTTNCSSVVNGFPIFEVAGMTSCNVATNSKKVAGNLIKIKDLTIQGKFHLEMSPASNSICQDTMTIYFSMVKNTLSSDNDSLFVLLPKGLHYLKNSTIGIRNMDSRNPLVIQYNEEEAVFYPINKGVPANDSILFSMTIYGLKHLLCSAHRITATTFSRITSKCKSTNSDCDVMVESGFDDLDISNISGNFNLDSFEIIRSVDSFHYNIKFQYILKDLKLFPDSILCIGLFEDLNGNKKLEASDKLILIDSINIASILTDGTYLYEKLLDTSKLYTCNYLLTSLFKNCVCKLDTLAYSFKRTKEFSFKDSLCSGQNIIIGIPGVDRKIYKWTSGMVACDSCSQFLFISDSNWVNDTSFHFILTEKDISDCDAIYSFDLRIFPLPTGDFTLRKSCPGELILIDAGDRNNYKWTGPHVTEPFRYEQQYINTTATFFYLSFKDEHLCPSQDTFEIIPAIDTNRIIILGDSTVLLGKSVRYCIIGGKSIMWESNREIDCTTCRCVTITPDKAGEYSYMVTVLDSFDCPHPFQFKLQALLPDCDETTVFVPNAFSPNHDGKNDILLVRGNNIENMRFAIYNRWGEKVFESHHKDFGWDGTFNNKLLTPDVFAYFLGVDCTGGKKYSRKGNISLLK